jgi:ABC-type nitrate/sulfonate/bicarbonate transport system permease component
MPWRRGWPAVADAKGSWQSAAPGRRRWYHYLIGVGLLLIGWEALALALAIPAFPRVMEALGALVQESLRGPLLSHAGVSLYRVAAATALSLVLGVPLGLYLGRSGGPIGSVLLYLAHPVPKVVFLPVILVVLGLGDGAKIFLIFLVIFFQIVVTVRDAAAAVPSGLIRSVRSLGGGEWHVYRHVVIPASLPSIFTALRLSSGTAVAVLFFAETYATQYGLGAYVWDAWSARMFDRMFAGVLAMALLGFGFYLLFDWMERRLCPWTEGR